MNYCKECCKNFSDERAYYRHLNSKSHNKRVNSVSELFKCECGKSYKHVSSLWNHKQKCKIIKETIIKSEDKQPEPMIEYLLKENIEIKKDNLEMKKMFIDVCQKLEPISHVSNVSNVNSHNKIFNINLFLNEDCKDAMNMTEFIESIKLSIEDVEKIGMEGQTQALSNILSSKLNEMDIFKRPVHCSDAKKEIIYVKDEDKWEQEEKDKPKLKKALDKIAKESLCKVPDMIPDADNYVKVISEILKDPREDKKILSEVSKDLLIN